MTDAQLIEWIIQCTNRGAAVFDGIHPLARVDVALGGGAGWLGQGPGFRIARDDLVRLAEGHIERNITRKLLK